MAARQQKLSKLFHSSPMQAEVQATTKPLALSHLSSYHLLSREVLFARLPTATQPPQEIFRFEAAGKDTLDCCKYATSLVEEAFQKKVKVHFSGSQRLSELVKEHKLDLSGAVLCLGEEAA
jgi:hypothetical protein